MEKISKAQYVVITAVICLILAFNFLRWQSLFIGIAFGLAYLLFYSFIFGSIFIKKNGWQVIFGLLFLLSLIAIAGAFFIYIYQFNDYFFITLLFLIPVLLIIPYYFSQIKEKFSLKITLKNYLAKFDERREPKYNSTLVIIYLILSTAGFYLLFLGQTVASIQAPWQVVSKHFFIIYFLATAILLTYLFNSFRTKLPLILLAIHSFLGSSVALIVYKIGYGFDPFIHQATEKIITQTGTINPKPLYYLGQYALVVFFHKLTLIDLEIIDRVLVPLLFAVFLPAFIFYVFSHWFKKNYALVLSLMILAIPFSSFIMTAPQNLANLFFIITILLSLLYFRNQIKISLLYFLGLTTLVIHPLAGIPLLITIVLFHLFKILYTSYIRYISLYFLVGLVFILFLPLALIANGSTINLAPAFQLSDLKLLNWVDKFDLPLNLAYLVLLNKFILAGLIIIAGLIYITKNKLLKNNAGYILAAGVIFIDYLIAKYFLTFPNLEEFDKNPFIGRLITLSFYILLPFFLLGLYWLIKNFWV